MHVVRNSLLPGARSARGVAVIIDVLRACTTAAYALAGGAREIVLVADVAEALALRERWPDAITAGEVEGLPVPEFDHDNSPTEVASANLEGRAVIQRTSSGTQGVVAARDADEILLGSFVTARATLRYLQERQPELVTVVAMGSQGRTIAGEDEACAEYLVRSLRGEHPDALEYTTHARAAMVADVEQRLNAGTFPWPDIDACAEIDRFDFAIQVAREGGLLIARRTP